MAVIGVSHFLIESARERNLTQNCSPTVQHNLITPASRNIFSPPNPKRGSCFSPAAPNSSSPAHGVCHLPSLWEVGGLGHWGMGTLGHWQAKRMHGWGIGRLGAWDIKFFTLGGLDIGTMGHWEAVRRIRGWDTWTLGYCTMGHRESCGLVFTFHR